MKLFLDFLPLVLFFGTFQYADKHKEWAAAIATSALGFMVSGGVVGTEEAPILLGTMVMSVMTLVQVVVLKLMRQKVHLMLWITFALVLTLGSATVYFHNPDIIKWKPSIAYWALGLSFWISRMVFHKNLLQEMLGAEMVLPPAVWQRLNFAWVAFLGLMGLLNLYVAYTFSTSTWASFKVFGATGLMIAFSVGQVVYLSKYMKPEEEDPPQDKPKESAP
ncbi:septation protein A [Piscinibacter terrae]|uniref:Inner membrane-spanning protein YciB n=1 Tax=Piscinibacter terrae TaxID=2496871 RepID=A0A3N7HPU1_9BURK|nr:septation protein A [Albitalea terrae]RQP23723.1 septation protein A [Albitalea terrae]